MSTFVSSQFPGAIATDASLKIAENGVLTALRGGVSSTDTTWTVGDASRILANMLLTCDNEIVNVVSISGSNVTVQRGFDGTTAASHNNNRPVFAAVDAWHHNALAAEVKAIESALGVNLANVGGSSGGSSALGITSTAYDFSPQTPGGSLVVGANVITLSPVPQGVNGTDAAHYLYISGGTGTAEPVLIIGGSATSGASSGTVIVTCANTHSGAWTVRSATAGIQEALNTLPSASGSDIYGGGTVIVPQGTHTTYATIEIRGNAKRLVGAGKNTSTISSAYKGGPLVFMNGTATTTGDTNEIRDLTIRGDGTAGTNFGLQVDNQSWGVVENVNITLMPSGVSVTGLTNSFVITFRHIQVISFLHDGIKVNASPSSGNFLDVNLFGDSTTGTNGFNIVTSGGLRVADSYIAYCGNGILMAPSATDVLWTEFVSTYIDVSVANGIAINPSSTGRVIGARFINTTTAFTQGSGNGVFIGSTGTVSGVSFIGHLSIINGSFGFEVLGGSNLSFTNCHAIGNSTVLPGTSGADGLAFFGGSNIEVSGGTYAQGWAQSNSQRLGIFIDASVTNITVQGATVTPNSAAGTISNGSSTARITNCRGYNPVGMAILTPGASPWTYTAGPTPEVFYYYGGTITSVVKGGAGLAGSPIILAPNQSVTITYTVVPTTAYADRG